MVAKFAGRQNKSYPMKSKVAYERDSKAVQREVEQTLADTLVPRNQAVQGDWEPWRACSSVILDS